MNFYIVAGGILFVCLQLGCSGEYLPTMSKDEVLRIIDCVFKSHNPKACKEFQACHDNRQAPRVKSAYYTCLKESGIPPDYDCNTPPPAESDPDQNGKIYDCIVKIVGKLQDQTEIDQQKDFESCLRAFKC